MKKGYWNGEHTATFVGVTYEVTQSDKELHWQNMFIGKRRQGIKITYNKSTWIIDNEHGDGHYKVTVGLGSPQCGHKSIFNPINVIEIPDDEINVKIDVDGFKAEDEAHDKFMEEKNPEEYKKIESLRKFIIDKYKQ